MPATPVPMVRCLLPAMPRPSHEHAPTEMILRHLYLPEAGSSPIVRTDVTPDVTLTKEVPDQE